MKCVRNLCAFVFTVVLTGSCFAADKISCPPMIKVEQKAVSSSEGWSVSYNSSPTDLEIVTFFSGPPEKNASLVYDEKSKVKGGWVGTWKFPKDPAGYWLRCSYRGTQAELSRRLPDSISACRVTYDETMHSEAGLPVIRKMECL